MAQGPLSRVDHFHTAVEIAHLLQLVAQGMSLRKASRAVRLEAHRFVEDRHGMRHASSEFDLAARYLDLFGTAIDQALAPTACPRILILDSKPMNLRAYGAETVRPGWNRAERGGAVLVAMGMDVPGTKAMPWRIGLAPDETGNSWFDFLSEIDPMGPGPDWVVADGASAIAIAVDRRWPEAHFYNCEFHLGRVLREAAQKDGIAIEQPAHTEMFTRAFWSDTDWERVTDFATSRSAPNLVRWCDANDELVRRQTAYRAVFQRFPRGNGAAEGLLDWIDGKFGRNRRYSLRNAARLQLVFSLVRAHHAGQADLAVFAAIIKREMKQLSYGARFDWTARQDPAHELCSIGQIIVDAHDRSTNKTMNYMAMAKTRSVIANVAAHNAELAGLGLPPLVATIVPGRKTPSVKTAGLLLAADFPLVARDWDQAANDEPLEIMKAGSGYVAHWKCHRCEHAWVARVVERTGRLTRCQRCSTERADGLNSLAATHPGLVREWDTVANAPLRPERIKTTYDRTVSWICPDDPEHPPYRMSPLTRGKKDIGCPFCRKKAASIAARAAPAA